MKKTLIIIILTIISLSAKAQYSYTPLSEQEIERIGRLLLQNKLDNLLSNTYFTLGVVDVGPCENFLSYNPIEGVRLRVSGKTNATLSKRFSFEWLLAYGIADKKLKYGASIGYNFAKKASSLYSFGAKTLSLSYYDNTYMPYLSDYDKIQYSLSRWTNYSIVYQRKATIKYFYEFQNAISLTPALHYRNYYSRLHYNDKEITQLIHTPLEYLIAEANITYQPGRKDARKTTKISLTYAYNFPLNNLERKYEELRLVAQRRFLLANNFSLDLRLSGGKIFGTTNPYLLLTPTMTNSLVSSVYGFNLLQYGRTTYHKQYLQTFAQFNLALKPSKITAFIYHKSLYGQYMPYHEIGIGLDNLFNNLGVEIIRSFSFEKETYPGMWGVRVRIK
mgnify:CR=1 FL=1